MKLSQIMQQVRGLSYDKKDISKDNLQGFIPVLRAGNIQDSKLNNEDLLFIPQQKVKQKQFLKFGDILIAASSGSISIVGKAAMVERNMNATFGAFCKVLRPDYKKVDFGYFKHFFETSYYKRTIKSLAEGANINNLKSEHFDELEIPLPPLEQQKKIAAILDAADAYRQKTKALIAKYDELTQSLFLDIFGDPVKNEKGWEKVELESCLQKVEKIGKTYSAKMIEYVDIASVDNIRNIITETTTYQTTEKPSRAQQILFSGDILFSTVRPNLKNIAINNLDGRIGSTGFCVCRVNPKKLNNLFLYKVLLSDSVTDYFVSITSGANYPAIKSSEMKKFQVIKPSISIQNQFAERVQAIEEQKAHAQASLEKAEDLFNSLLQRAFKGELV